MEILKSLLDWNTLRASFRAAQYNLPPASDLGEGSDIDYTKCAKADVFPQESPLNLKNEVDLLYDRYVRRIINKPATKEAKEAFKRLIKTLQAEHIEVEIVILPYHPEFLARLKRQHPEIYVNHSAWIHWLEKIQDSGVHFTCKGVIEMMGSPDKNMTN